MTTHQIEMSLNSLATLLTLAFAAYLFIQALIDGIRQK